MVVVCVPTIYLYKAFYVFVCYCPIYTGQYKFLCICVLLSYSYMPVQILKYKLNDSEGPMMKSVAGGILLPSKKGNSHCMKELNGTNLSIT